MKKLLALFLALCMCLCVFAGCGAKKTDDPAGDDAAGGIDGKDSRGLRTAAMGFIWGIYGCNTQ